MKMKILFEELKHPKLIALHVKRTKKGEKTGLSVLSIYHFASGIINTLLQMSVSELKEKEEKKIPAIYASKSVTL